MQPLNWKVSEKAIQWSLKHALGKIILPSETSALRDREKEFQRLIAELKRLASKKGYSQETDRFREWSYGNDCQSLVDGVLVNRKAAKVSNG